MHDTSSNFTPLNAHSHISAQCAYMRQIYITASSFAY